MPGKVARHTRNLVQAIARWLTGAFAFGFGLIAYAYLTLPDIRQLASTNPKTSAFMELRSAEARAQGRIPRKSQRWIEYRRISPNLKRAVLVAEDAAFWDHDGVDYAELQKSIELDWARGQLLRGASTITQQLAKNLYLSPSRNPIRKLRELMIARRLEGELTKARILELYLNVIEWGDGIYGVDAAAHVYFSGSASSLTPVQSALLAGAIINPRVLNPGKPTARLLRRQQLILRRMGAVTPPSESIADDSTRPSSGDSAPREANDPPVPVTASSARDEEQLPPAEPK